MNVGMLWFDNDPKADLITKVNRAAKYYQDKYGKNATLCFVHPNMLADESLQVGDVEVRKTRSILPNHLWIGLQK